MNFHDKNQFHMSEWCLLRAMRNKLKKHTFYRVIGEKNLFLSLEFCRMKA